MILVRNVRLLPGEPAEKLKSLAAKKLRIKETEITGLHLTKRSLDARKKNDIHYVCACAVKVSGDEEKIIARAKSPDVSKYEKIEYAIPRVEPPVLRPVVVGFGPAGMFAALVLARAGARPIVIERGQDALSRKAAVDRLRSVGKLDPESNVQFGEGGAGTFSDGKLNTGTHDKRMGWMLSQF
ncbi:MAG: FAD-dependent monooxygenase, partial [Dysosmobacter sp.]